MDAGCQPKSLRVMRAETQKRPQHSHTPVGALNLQQALMHTSEKAVHVLLWEEARQGEAKTHGQHDAGCPFLNSSEHNDATTND
eukprot:9100293-Alexandrium_andersonii.AAC.1